MKISLLLFLVGCSCLPESGGSIWADIFQFDFTPGPYQASHKDADKGQDHSHHHVHSSSGHQHEHGSSGHQHEHGSSGHQHEQGSNHKHVTPKSSQKDHHSSSSHQHEHSSSGHQHVHSSNHKHATPKSPQKDHSSSSHQHHHSHQSHSHHHNHHDDTATKTQHSHRPMTQNASQEGQYVYNASSPHSTVCPMLYTVVGDRCIAFFTVARVPWSAAREFCHGIFGELITFKDVHQYIDLLTYLQSSELDVDLWVGGRESSEESKEWVWVDDTPMPMGSPYWAIRMDEIASRSRYVANKNIVYTQAPLASRAMHVDRCAAMTSKYFYYLTDEWCRLWKSPVCVLKEDVEVVVVKGSEDTYPGIFLPQDQTLPSVLVTEGSTQPTRQSPDVGVVEDSTASKDSMEDVIKSLEKSSEEVEGSGSMLDLLDSKSYFDIFGAPIDQE